MAELIVLCGFPASGKTTWAHGYVREHPQCVRVSSDDLIAMLKGSAPYDSIAQRAIVQPAEVELVQLGLKADYCVIVDRTNLGVTDRLRWIGVARTVAAETGREVRRTLRWFDCSEKVWVARNAARWEDAVPEEAIARMKRRFDTPDVEEGWDQVLRITDNGTSELS